MKLNKNIISIAAIFFLSFADFSKSGKLFMGHAELEISNDKVYESDCYVLSIRAKSLKEATGIFNREMNKRIGKSDKDKFRVWEVTENIIYTK